MSYNYISETGVIIPDTSEILQQVEQEWRDIAGEDVTIDPSSSEGRFIASIVKERISVARNNADLANQLNPNLSNGTFLDSQLELIGAKRIGSARSSVECVLTGVAGTFIASGSTVEDVNQKIWALVSDATISATNEVTASFRSIEEGAIFANSGEVNRVVTGVLGWETVNNPDASTVGTDTENDITSRKKRRVQLGANSRSVSHSIIAAISGLEGVLAVQFRENYTNSNQTIDNVDLIPKSTWVCVDGGVTSEIAEAYHVNRWGTDFNGDEEYTYTDPSNNQEMVIKLDRPTYKPLVCRVTVRVGSSQDAASDVKSAIINYVNGNVDGEDGFSLGLDASPFEVGAAVNAQLTGVFIQKCELGINTISYSTDTIFNEIYEKATLTESEIEVILV